MAVRLKSPLEVAACVAAQEVKCIVMFEREVVHSRRVGKNKESSPFNSVFAHPPAGHFSDASHRRGRLRLSCSTLGRLLLRAHRLLFEGLCVFARASCASPARLKAISASGAWQRSGCTSKLTAFHACLMLSDVSLRSAGSSSTALQSLAPTSMMRGREAP